MKKFTIILFFLVTMIVNLPVLIWAGAYSPCVLSSEKNPVFGDYNDADPVVGATPFETVNVGFTPMFHSIDVITSAQSIALGESFVANPHGINAFKSNPAALIGIDGLNIYYNHRPMGCNGILENAYYYSLGLIFDASIGKFGIDYSRLDYGSPIDTRTIYMPNVQLEEMYDHTFTISTAFNLYRGIIAGANLKYYNSVTNYAGDVADPETNGAIVADLGILYKMIGFASDESINDYFRFGLSLQNYGTKYQINDSDFELPRYFRAGFSYELTNFQDQGREFHRLLLTAEYKRHLNPNEYYDDERNYGGIGFDYRLIEIFSLRVGALIQPYDNIYGQKNKLSMRYGFGINLPFRKLGFKSPLTLSFDYANIPLNKISYLEFNKDNLSVLTFVLKYEKSLF